MPAIDISPAQDGGVLKEIIKEGISDETPPPGCTVRVHYTGTLLDGTKFDSSKDRNEPLEFILKRKVVIEAWYIGIATMKMGEVAILTCAPKYAYGKAGSPPTIPPDATLKFEIEVIDWKHKDISPYKDESIEKCRITKGTGRIKPNRGALVDVHFIGMYNDKVFEERDVQFTLGEGEACGIIEGVELALLNFIKGEKAKLKIKSKYAFKNEGKPEFGIPPDATVDYIVELKNYEKGVESWTLNTNEKIEQAKLVKEKGTKYFKENKYKLAIRLYKRVDHFLSEVEDAEGDLKAECNNLMLSAYLNLALCYLKTNDNDRAIHSCNSALKLSPQNEKALFRRGQAYLALMSPEIAIKDFQEVLNVEPKNTAAVKQVAICNNLIQKRVAREKKLYANMFDKFAREDKQKEEEKLRQQVDVMHETLGEWGQEERPGGRDATAFEKENPNILMLNANGTGEFQNM